MLLSILTAEAKQWMSQVIENDLFPNKLLFIHKQITVCTLMNHVQDDKQVLHCKKKKKITEKIIFDHIW